MLTKIYNEIFNLRQELLDGFYIEIITICSVFVLNICIYYNPSTGSLSDVFGILTWVVLPIYLIFRDVKKDKVRFRQNAVLFIFILTFNILAFTNFFVSDYFWNKNTFLWNQFASLGFSHSQILFDLIIDLILAPFNIFFSIIIYESMIRPRFFH